MTKNETDDEEEIMDDSFDFCIIRYNKGLIYRYIYIL